MAKNGFVAEVTFDRYKQGSEYAYILQYLTIITSIKVSEYPFKQNRNMLKNMKVLLLTYFHGISLNALRSTLFNIQSTSATSITRFSRENYLELFLRSLQHSR